MDQGNLVPIMSGTKAVGVGVRNGARDTGVHAWEKALQVRHGGPSPNPAISKQRTVKTTQLDSPKAGWLAPRGYDRLIAAVAGLGKVRGHPGNGKA